MFAIAAFALSGMAIAPAFASHPIVSDQYTMVSGFNETDIIDVGCGSSDECQAGFSGYAGTSIASLHFGVTGNTSCSQVDGHLVGSGWHEHQTAYNVDYTGGQWNFNGPSTIDVDDVMTYTVEYTSCS